jgi:uncharacterized protein (TIGR02099 family)
MDWLRVIIPVDFLIQMFAPNLPFPPRLSLALSRAVQVTAWALLILGILLGMAWGTLHFWIVPRIEDYRPALERLAQQSIGIPVRIGAITAKSSGWVPTFELHDIEWLDAEGHTALRLPKVMLAISVRSVLGLKLEQLVLDRPEIDVRLLATGHWRVAGLDWGTQPSGNNTAANWLFAQREVIVRGGTLHWTRESTLTPPPNSRLPRPSQNSAGTTAHTETSLVRVSLKDLDLVLRNSARHHDVRMDATPPPDWGQRFVSIGRFKRSLLSIQPGQWADWTGQVYSYFPHVDVAQLSPHMPSGIQLRAGQGSLRLWGDVSKGQWTGGVADVHLARLNAAWAASETPLAFERFSGRLAGHVDPLGFEVSTHHLAFVSAQGLAWPGGNAALRYTHPQGKKAAHGQLQADQLDLFALREMALRMPLPKMWRERLQQQAVHGRVETLQWRWQGHWRAPQTYDGQLTVQQLSLPPNLDPAKHGTPSWPGLKNAHAQVKLNQDLGRIDIRMGADGAVFLPGILEEAEVRTASLHAHAVFKRDAAQWHVPEWKLDLANADLQGAWQGQWHPAKPGQGPGLLDLQGKFKRLDVSKAHRYLPLSLPANVRQYVRDAVVKGTYSDVQVRIKGDLAKRPWVSAADGDLQISGRLQDVELDYLPAALRPPHSPPWPSLHKLKGQLAFDRLNMKLSDVTAQAGEGRTSLNLSAGQAEITDMLHAPVLNIAAEINGAASQMLTLVKKSPLDALLSGALQQTEATGSVQTRLQLAVPLLTPQNTKVQGTLVLAGNDVRMTASTPLLEKLQGTVQFSDAGFTLNGAQAQLLGGPIRIEGGMRPTSGTNSTDSPLQLRIQGQVSAEGLRQAKEISPLNDWAQHASGNTHYSAQLAWRQGQPEFTLQSQLEGLALKLPAPLGKAASTSTPVLLRTRIHGSGSSLRDELQLEWGSAASAHYVRDLSGPQAVVLRGSLTLGLPASQALAMPETGVVASVMLENFVVNDWQILWPTPDNEAQPQTTQDNAAWQNYGPTRIGLQANTLTADGRTLHQVMAGGLREDRTWRINVDARELSGHVVYRQPSGDQLGHLFARLSRLNLPPSSVAEVEALLQAPPANLPSLDIVVEQMELRGKNLGRIEIEALNTEPRKTRGKVIPEWQLNKFNIIVPEASLRSTARWLAANEDGQQRKTEMNFKLDIADAGELLTRLGTPDALRGGTGQLEGSVAWQGSPLALHYPSMSGQLTVHMDRGQFLKADAGAAKLLGVLSLQALPRRLLLDFKDVFYEGFAFDTVRGDVTITQGIAHTRNMQIKGVNALVQLDGSADIAKETQNLQVLILPVLDAGTASLLAGIAVNPILGLTTFLTQWFLQSPLVKANTQKLLIDGSWAQPRVTKIKRTEDGLAVPQRAITP